MKQQIATAVLFEITISKHETYITVINITNILPCNYRINGSNKLKVL